MIITPELLTAIALWCGDSDAKYKIDECRQQLVMCVERHYTYSDVAECFKKTKCLGGDDDGRY